ncbi:hypothetical protein DFJ74DRAFT_769326 [Hyaloraphidium curvatum]|nr:hypothetical protein DFJ74DRAFT_769326 [Hyaloraphidium curvatum]
MSFLSGLWSGGAPPAKPSSAAPPRKPRANPAGLDFSLPTSFDDDVEGAEFDESELNDPALLRELQALAGDGGNADDDDEAALASLTKSTAKPPAAKAPRAAPPPVSTAPAPRPAPPKPPPEPTLPPSPADDPIAALGIEVPTDPHADVEVEFGEEDENDPELLAELNKVHPGAAGPSSPAAASPPPAPDDMDEGEPEEADEGPTIEEMLGASDAKMLTKYIEKQKVKAVKLKRAGDTTKARKALVDLKQLEQKVASLSQPDLGPSLSPSPGPARSPSPSPKPSSNPQLNLLRKRLQEYRTAALAAKKAGDMPKARDHLVAAKRIGDAVSALESGRPLPQGFADPGPPSTKPSGAPAAKPVPRPLTKPVGDPRAQPLGTTAIPDVPPSPADSAPAADLPTFLATSLRHQISSCTAAAAFAYRRGDKDLALRFHKLKKLYTADLETVEALARSGRPMPPFRTETVEYRLERQLPDLDPGELEVCIGGCENLAHRDVRAADLDVSCTFDLGYPAGDGDATKPEGTGTTAQARGPDPRFGFAQRVPVDRTSRSFARHLERKKLVVEAWHSRGWFRGKVSLGRAQIPLAELLGKCEVREVAELADPSNPRRGTGGRVEVAVRMRTPLKGPEVVEVAERWVSLDVGDGRGAAMPRKEEERGDVPPSAGAAGVKAVVGGEGKPAATLERPGPKAPSPTLPRSSSPARQPGPAAPPTQPSPVAPANPSKPSAAEPAPALPEPAEDADDLAASFDSPDAILSNAVVEHELGTCDARIAAARTPAEREDAAMRKQALQIREQMLVIAVQTGKLTMDGYLAQLRAGAVEAKKLALRFKQAARMDYAKRALERSKIMEREAGEVEEMIRQEAEGGGGEE